MNLTNIKWLDYSFSSSLDESQLRNNSKRYATYVSKFVDDEKNENCHMTSQCKKIKRTIKSLI